MIKRIGVIGAGQMGSGIAHVCALKGFEIRLADIDQSHLDKGIDAIGRNMDRQISRGMIRSGGQGRGARAHLDRHRLQAVRRLRPDRRGGDRERGGEARDLQEGLRGTCRQRPACDQYLVDLGDEARRGDRPARQVHGHALHEPGPADGPGRADPRHRHGGGDLPHGARGRGQARQEAGQRRGLPGLHREPHPAADDQRGGLCALRRRRQRRGRSTPA